MSTLIVGTLKSAYQGQCPSRMLCRDALHEHVCLGCNHCGVNESQKEEGTNKRANSIVGRVRVLSLKLSQKLVENLSGVHCSAHLGQTPDLLADPSNSIRDGLQAINDCHQKAVCNLHKHCETRGDNSLDIGVSRSCVRCNAPRKMIGKSAGVFFDLVDHLLVNLRRTCE
jgi:hypothetical protein